MKKGCKGEGIERDERNKEGGRRRMKRSLPVASKVIRHNNIFIITKKKKQICWAGSPLTP